MLHMNSDAARSLSWMTAFGILAWAQHLACSYGMCLAWAAHAMNHEADDLK